MTFSKLHKALLCLSLLVAGPAAADQAVYEFDGHIKTRLLGDWFPDDSVFHGLTGAHAFDIESDLRLNLDVSRGGWDLDLAWQLFAGYGDRIEYSRSFAANTPFSPARLPNDERRLFNLTSVIDDHDKFAALHRLDRLSIGYTSDRLALRFGRQALSWGNGLVFSPMDIVNPFDPVAIDTEYKAGDDMVYGQLLRSNGDDIQVAYVVRRDVTTGDPSSDQSTAAIKYHGILGESEYDVLIAKHYDEPTLAVGGNRSVAGAVWRADLVISDANSATKIQLVTNLSYSWSWNSKNFSGVVEYFFNEFGIKGGNYDFISLSQNAELLDRLARGDTFTLGRNYLAAGLTVELTALWNMAPNLFVNLDDGSALLQLVSNNNLSQNIDVISALNIPVGPSGSEFGGIGSEIAGVYLSTDLALFVQIAWYF